MASGMKLDPHTERSVDPNRQPRDVTDNRTIIDDRARQDAERIRAFRAGNFQVILPDLPPIDGYHVCWLSTTNPSDTVAARLRLGYELMKASDYPEFQHLSAKSAGYEGHIMVNEMIAAKIPIDLWHAFMEWAHHEAPLSEDRKIVELIERYKAQAQANKGDLIEYDGMQDFRVAPPKPSFYDAHHGMIERGTK